MATKTNNQVFPSASAIVSWAGATQMKRLDDDVIYVCKNDMWHYFGKYGKEYRLIFTFSKDLGETND